MIFLLLCIWVSWVDIKTLTVPLLPVVIGTIYGLATHDFRVASIGAAVGFISICLIAKLAYFYYKREAMGMGDAYWMLCVGTFVGWQGALFTIWSACMIGVIVSLFIMLAGKYHKYLEVPFIPFLSAGALLWMYCGPQIIQQVF